MSKAFILLIILIGASAAFFGYCAVLIDWIQNYSAGVYSQTRLEVIVESVALFLYTFFGVKFFYRHVNSLR